MTPQKNTANHGRVMDTATISLLRCTLGVKSPATSVAVVSMCQPQESHALCGHSNVLDSRIRLSFGSLYDFNRRAIIVRPKS